MPRGLSAAIRAAVELQGTTWLKMWHSRIRLAMSWLYCEP